MFYIVLVLSLFVWMVVLNYSRANKLSNIFVILIITTLFVINRQNQDYDAYVDIFTTNELYAEVGYRWLIYAVKYLGGTHDTIIIIMGLFVGITLLRLSRYCQYIAFAAILYMLCPMPIDIVQVRNTFLLMFLINSLIELEKGRKIRSLSFLFLVVMFHSLGIIYLLGWIIIQFRKWKSYNFLMMIGLISSFVITPVFIKALIFIFDTRTLHAYISESIKVHSLVIWGAPFLLNIFLIYQLKKIAVITNPDVRNWIELIFSLMLFLALFSPLLLYIDEINRIYRNSMLLNGMVIMSLAPYLNKQTRYSLFAYLLVFSLTLSVYYTSQIDYDYIVFGMPYSLQ